MPSGRAPENEPAKDWYRTAFGETYASVYAHRDEAEATRDIRFAAEHLNLKTNLRILDLACGEGRHLLAGSRQGFRVFGVDLSRALLARATKGEVRAVARADMRALPFGKDIFDGAWQIFSSFGYFEKETEDLRVLMEVHRVLKPKSRYLLDYLDAEWVRNHLVPVSLRKASVGEIEEQRRIQNHRVEKRVRIRGEDGSLLEEYWESVRLYSPLEMKQLFQKAGFSVVKTFGSMTGGNPGSGSRHVLVAEKRA